MSKIHGISSKYPFSKSISIHVYSKKKVNVQWQNHKQIIRTKSVINTSIEDILFAKTFVSSIVILFLCIYKVQISTSLFCGKGECGEVCTILPIRCPNPKFLRPATVSYNSFWSQCFENYCGHNSYLDDGIVYRSFNRSTNK